MTFSTICHVLLTATYDGAVWCKWDGDGSSQGLFKQEASLLVPAPQIPGATSVDTMHGFGSHTTQGKPVGGVVLCLM